MLLHDEFIISMRTEDVFLYICIVHTHPSDSKHSLIMYTENYKDLTIISYSNTVTCSLQIILAYNIRTLYMS